MVIQKYVFPSNVGINRARNRYPVPALRVPLERGDQPRWARLYCPDVMCSPRTWGSTEYRDGRRESRGVFPSNVGINRLLQYSQLFRPCVPLERGDQPGWSDAPHMTDECSPRTWGSTAWSQNVPVAWPVFPSNVGINRCGSVTPDDKRSVPLERGDQPLNEYLLEQR